VDISTAYRRRIVWLARRWSYCWNVFCEDGVLCGVVRFQAGAAVMRYLPYTPGNSFGLVAASVGWHGMDGRGMVNRRRMGNGRERGWVLLRRSARRGETSAV